MSTGHRTRRSPGSFDGGPDAQGIQRTVGEIKADAKIGPTRSPTRVLGLFEAMAKASDGITLAQLSTSLRSPKSSLLLLLAPLVTSGYITHSNNLYRLGPTILRLSADILSTRSFPRIIRPYMEDLVEITRETVFLAVINREAECAVYIESIDSPQEVRYTTPVGTARPLYCSAAGRLLLAYEKNGWRDAYVNRVELKPLTAYTLTSRGVLRRELQKIQMEGLAISINEAVPGAAGIAAPIFNPDGTVAAALLIGAPVDRFQHHLPALRDVIKTVATRVSGAMPSGTPN